MKVKWFRISLVFTYKKWNTGALHGHLEKQNFPSLLEGLLTRTSQVAKGSDLYRADKSTKLCMVVA